ncbi:arginine--tRNA ligase domain-containing protein [Conexibacter woesei]|uniref:Arginyl-tRNA synthetase-like protein n=1 Tax=Conexibacter woesei (strain DSM 14684 / CCUG 47730 / CIP 108061 / JCM 11494 / NBRC 100937 / ID131577) TaxID=469383 RepID=D3FCG4_CONWI|nr:arginine--tRNA ligase [Conexibacter woesei]ADB49437.1 Arginyl-tRNA synthetase-like protein [Conexibacter woesei DSM 14684]
MSDQAPLRADNLLDGVEATLRRVDADAFRVVPVLRQDDAADVGAITRDRALADAAVEVLRADPALDADSVTQEQQRFLMRFTDARIAELGAGLEEGRLPGMETRDLRAGERAIVDFCDPNATKALHIGHLRNIALGQAISSALRAAGAHVERQSHIGDAGRSMGEALAGYRRYAEPGTPAEAGVKSDQFVGDLYARYAREESPIADVADEDAPVARDLDERDDLAQQLLTGIEQDDADAVALWRTVRGWAVAGQNETLARLGVHFERILYDSDRTARTAEVARLGIERGVFVREERGTVAYLTGDDSYPVMPLTRADGFPTHHLRVVAMWRDMMIDEEGSALIHLSGDEWKAHVQHVEELLGRLEPALPVLPSQHVLHGMVSSEVDGELSSSKGTAQLIDELLDELVARPEVTAVAREGRPGVGAEDLVAMAVLGFCLDKPVVKGLILPPVARLLDPEANTGWRVALAWAKAWDPANDGPADPAPGDSDYRHIVLQSQLHRRNLAVALDGLDLLKYVRYVGHLSEWYLARDADPRVGRVMRAILSSGLGALGLVRSAGADGAGADGATRTTDELTTTGPR